MYDIIIIGAGPAGLTAAINARVRNKSVLVLTNDWKQTYLYQAKQIDNYPGHPGISGAEILESLVSHAKELGAEIDTKRVLTIMPMDDQFYVSAGARVEQAKSIILAIGTGSHAKLPGETDLVGRGVSYCATCDGMLYRNGKRVVVVGKAADAVEEANFLKEIGCVVTFVSQKPVEGLADGIEQVTANRLEIKGEGAVEVLVADGNEIPADGIFVFRQTVAPTDLLPGLKTEDGGIWVDRRMETSIPGIFAAGDCTGRPLQVMKAMGEGQRAALSAVEDLNQPTS
ncbi:MAG: NAD(P)/FAD-dependent oxidoreductase [Oscillospiraceae bacterium]|jgi:thioredoxin reductase (NADPH)